MLHCPVLVVAYSSWILPLWLDSLRIREWQLNSLRIHYKTYHLDTWKVDLGNKNSNPTNKHRQIQGLGKEMLGYRTQIWTNLLNDCAPHAIFWIRHLVSVYVKLFVRLYVMFCQQRRLEGCLRHQGIIDFSRVRAPVCLYFVQDRFVMTVRRRWINERQKTPFRFNLSFEDSNIQARHMWVILNQQRKLKCCTSYFSLGK